MLTEYFCKVSVYTKLFLLLVKLRIVSCKNKMAACTALEANSESKWFFVMGEKNHE